MNKCHFAGRLTKDPEIRYTVGAQPVAVAHYTLAVDRRRKKEGEQTADFINFVAYAGAAEFAEKYLKKGIKMIITARCQTRKYNNNEGKTVYVTEFIVEDQEFAESKKASGNETAGQETQDPYYDDFSYPPEGIENDDDIPF